MCLSARFLLICLAVCAWSAAVCSVHARPIESDAWKRCQSSDADQRISGCSEVVSQGRRPKSRLADALDGRCWAYHVKGLYELAVADCRASISLRPNYSYSYNNLSSAFLGLKNFGEAANAARKAIELKPRFFWSHLNLARSLAGLGELDRARAEYQIALAIEPSSSEATEELRILSAQTAEKLNQPSSSETSTRPSGGASLPIWSKPSRRVALVIGNSKYSSVPELPNPVRDTDLISQTLKSIGFDEVIAGKNLSRDALHKLLLEFSKKSSEADWSVIYYSGHGIEVGGADYMIPVDAHLESDRDVDFETVPLSLAISAADGARKLRMVIMDACRSNPFLSQMKRTIATRSLGRGLAAVEPEPGSLVIFSAKHGETALDGDGSNSPFAIALASRLKVAGLEVRRLFDLVRDDVLLATNRRQQPFSYGSLSGNEDYFFVAK
ncbi:MULTISPECIES: caspase family protein [unclassified Bradyrhizobium]|uniref:caspase family protein n=1 Tax=unclassified Bradyrhizobium TaxID=2631580 RepID=UPI0028F12C82|nr:MULTISPECIES: caspase family protein [unclassified Bradyrhizobium]